MTPAPTCWPSFRNETVPFPGTAPFPNGATKCTAERTCASASQDQDHSRHPAVQSPVVQSRYAYLQRKNMYLPKRFTDKNLVPFFPHPQPIPPSFPYVPKCRRLE